MRALTDEEWERAKALQAAGPDELVLMAAKVRPDLNWRKARQLNGESAAVALASPRVILVATAERWPPVMEIKEMRGVDPSLDADGADFGYSHYLGYV